MISIDTAHEDMIHDAQLDYYGKKLASCSSDRTVKVFDVNGDQYSLSAELKGHEGPVWQVAWAHPKFGTLLASCSYDRKVIIWKDNNGSWGKIYEYFNHDSSVNGISWAPHEFGLMLTCASSDGYISVIAYAEQTSEWQSLKFIAHSVGCNAVSWAPAIAPGALVEHSSKGTSPLAPRRFASAGSDNLVKIWRFSEEQNTYALECVLEGHTDWVRDVAWAPSIGLPVSTIASCGQDGNVFIWTSDKNESAEGSSSYTKVLLNKFQDVVWKASWSLTGNILAVSGGDNKVTLWKESLEGNWTHLDSLDETAANEAADQSVSH